MSNQATSDHSSANLTPVNPVEGIRSGGRTSPLRTGGLLLLIIVCCLPPMLLDSGKPPPRHWMEAVSLHTSRETWLAIHDGDSGAWLTPTQNGDVRVKKPPMLVWLNLLTWSNLEPDADPQELIARARMVTAGLSVLAIVGVFWIGATLGGRNVGLFSALVAATLPFLQSQARMASYDMHLVAWVTLAVACGLWAVRPGGTPASVRRVITGGALSGLFLSAAWLTKGPMSALQYLIPMVIVGVLTSGLRRHVLIVMGIAVAICAAAVTPWYVHVHSVEPEAFERLREEYSGADTNTQRPYYYVVNLFKLAMPWTVWLIGGLVMPFKSRGAGERRSMYIAWWWFVLVLVALSINPGKAERYILPIVPSLAILAGWVFARHQAMATSPATAGDDIPQINLLRVPHWIGLAIASVALACVVGWPDWLRERDWFEVPDLSSIGVPAAIGMLTILLLLVGWGARQHWRRRSDLAVLATALWTIVATTAYWHGSATADHSGVSVREGGTGVAEIVADAPLRSFRFHGESGLKHDFLFYLGRVVKSVRPKDDARAALDKYVARGEGSVVYLMALDTDAHADALGDYGFHRVQEFNDTAKTHRILWRYPQETDR